MSKQEADRLADALVESFPAFGDGTRSGRERLAHEAAALLRQWPDGEPVAWQAQVFNVRHLTGEVRLRGINGAEVPQDFVESGTIVEVRAVGTAPPDSAARIAELEAENAALRTLVELMASQEGTAVFTTETHSRIDAARSKT